MDGRPRNIWQGKADEWAKIAESKELPSYERLIDLGERLAALPIAARRFADIVAVVGLETEKLALAQQMLDSLAAIKRTVAKVSWPGSEYWSTRALEEFVKNARDAEAE
jgi:hypothetical protein